MTTSCTSVRLPDACGRDSTFLTRRMSVYAFTQSVADAMDTADHRREFSVAASPYNVSPGDMDAHSHVYGLSGVERSTIRDVVGVRQCAAATTYAARDKWNQKMGNFIRSALDRAALNGAERRVGGGAGSEAQLEQLAVLHTLNNFFLGRMRVQFLHWFVITHRGAERSFQLQVQKAVRNGLPFIFQHLGRWACCVPKVPPPLTPRVIEMTTNLIGRSDVDEDDDGMGEGNVGGALYLCQDVAGAVAVWATFLTEGWGGQIHHSGKKLGPALRAMLAFTRK